MDKCGKWKLPIDFLDFYLINDLFAKDKITNSP